MNFQFLLLIFDFMERFQNSCKLFFKIVFSVFESNTLCISGPATPSTASPGSGASGLTTTIPNLPQAPAVPPSGTPVAAAGSSHSKPPGGGGSNPGGGSRSNRNNAGRKQHGHDGHHSKPMYNQ